MALASTTATISRVVSGSTETVSGITISEPALSMASYACVQSNSWCGLTTGVTFTSLALEKLPKGRVTWRLTEVVLSNPSSEETNSLSAIVDPSGGCELRTTGTPTFWTNQIVFRVTAPGLATGTSCEFYYPYPNDGRNDRQINYKLGGPGGETFSEVVANAEVSDPWVVTLHYTTEIACSSGVPASRVEDISNLAVRDYGYYSALSVCTACESGYTNSRCDVPTAVTVNGAVAGSTLRVFGGSPTTLFVVASDEINALTLRSSCHVDDGGEIQSTSVSTTLTLSNYPSLIGNLSVCMRYESWGTGTTKFIPIITVVKMTIQKVQHRVVSSGTFVDVLIPKCSTGTNGGQAGPLEMEGTGLEGSLTVHVPEGGTCPGDNVSTEGIMTFSSQTGYYTGTACSSSHAPRKLCISLGNGVATQDINVTISLCSVSSIANLAVGTALRWPATPYGTSRSPFPIAALPVQLDLPPAPATYTKADLRMALRTNCSTSSVQADEVLTLQTSSGACASANGGCLYPPGHVLNASKGHTLQFCLSTDYALFASDAQKYPDPLKTFVYRTGISVQLVELASISESRNITILYQLLSDYNTTLQMIANGTNLQSTDMVIMVHSTLVSNGICNPSNAIGPAMTMITSSTSYLMFTGEHLNQFVRNAHLCLRTASSNGIYLDSGVEVSVTIPFQRGPFYWNQGVMLKFSSALTTIAPNKAFIGLAWSTGNCDTALTSSLHNIKDLLNAAVDFNIAHPVSRSASSLNLCYTSRQDKTGIVHIGNATLLIPRYNLTNSIYVLGGDVSMHISDFIDDAVMPETGVFIRLAADINCTTPLPGTSDKTITDYTTSTAKVTFAASELTKAHAAVYVCINPYPAVQSYVALHAAATSETSIVDGIARPTPFELHAELLAISVSPVANTTLAVGAETYVTLSIPQPVPSGKSLVVKLSVDTNVATVLGIAPDTVTFTSTSSPPLTAQVALRALLPHPIPITVYTAIDASTTTAQHYTMASSTLDKPILVVNPIVVSIPEEDMPIRAGVLNTFRVIVSINRPPANDAQAFRLTPNGAIVFVPSQVTFSPTSNTSLMNVTATQVMTAYSLTPAPASAPYSVTWSLEPLMSGSSSPLYYSAPPNLDIVVHDLANVRIVSGLSPTAPSTFYTTNHSWITARIAIDAPVNMSGTTLTVEVQPTDGIGTTVVANGTLVWTPSSTTLEQTVRITALQPGRTVTLQFVLGGSAAPRYRTTTNRVVQTLAPKSFGVTATHLKGTLAVLNVSQTATFVFVPSVLPDAVGGTVTVTPYLRFSDVMSSTPLSDVEARMQQYITVYPRSLTWTRSSATASLPSAQNITITATQTLTPTVLLFAVGGTAYREYTSGALDASTQLEIVSSREQVHYTPTVLDPAVVLVGHSVPFNITLSRPPRRALETLVLTPHITSILDSSLVQLTLTFNGSHSSTPSHTFTTTETNEACSVELCTVQATLTASAAGSITAVTYFNVSLALGGTAAAQYDDPPTWRHVAVRLVARLPPLFDSYMIATPPRVRSGRCIQTRTFTLPRAPVLSRDASYNATFTVTVSHPHYVTLVGTTSYTLMPDASVAPTVLQGTVTVCVNDVLPPAAHDTNVSLSWLLSGSAAAEYAPPDPAAVVVTILRSEDVPITRTASVTWRLLYYFYVRSGVDAATLEASTDLQRQVIGDVEALSPGTLTGRVSIISVRDLSTNAAATAGSVEEGVLPPHHARRMHRTATSGAVVEFQIADLSTSEWQAALVVISSPASYARLQASTLRAQSPLVSSEDSARVSDAIINTRDVHTCASTVALSAVAPVHGTGVWTVRPSSSDTYLSSTSATTSLRGLVVNTTYNVSWGVTQLAVLSTSDWTTVTRHALPTIIISHMLASNGTMTIADLIVGISAVASLPSSSSVWSVATGQAQIEDHNATHARVAGVGNVSVMYTRYVSVADACSVSVSVALAFPHSPSTCRPFGATSATPACSGNGVCIDGVCACRSSSLLGHYDGILCERCAHGYRGASCIEAIPCYEMGEDVCSRHGKCDSVTGACECYRNATHGHWDGTHCASCMWSRSSGYWVGATCSTCAAAYHGDTCTTFCVDSIQCNGHGVCNDQGSGCVCDTTVRTGFWGGPACDHCAIGYVGETCTERCYDDTTCSGHGMCGAGTCQCTSHSNVGFWNTSSAALSATPTVFCDVCQSNYTGATCQRRLDGLCNASTCIHGTCSPNGTVCTCHADTTRGFWSGHRCELCEGHFTGATCTECHRGYWGAMCDIECPWQQCGGANRGYCTRTDGFCICDRNSFASGMWNAATGCQTCIPGYFGAKCNAHCDARQSCGGRGTCDPNTGACVCHANATAGYWSGVSCSVCASARSVGSVCKACLPNYYGPNCSTFCDPAVTCSGHGSCDASTGQCICVDGDVLGHWSGGNVGDCSVCTFGWTGVACTTPWSLAAVCHGRWLNVSLVAARFSASFNHITLHFNTTTSSPDGLACNDYFDVATMQLLGSDPQCTWSSRDALLVRLGDGFTVSTTSTLQIRSQVIQATDQSTGDTQCSFLSSFDPVKISLPTAVYAPASMLSMASSSVSFCEPIILRFGQSVVGSPKTAFVISYIPELSEHTFDADYNMHIQNYLRDGTVTSELHARGELTVPHSVASLPGTYAFELTLLDSMTGLRSSSRTSVLKRDSLLSAASLSQPAPVSLSLATPRSQDTAISQSTRMGVQASYSPCYPLFAYRPVEFVYRVVSAPSSIDGWATGIQNNASTVVFPSHSFRVPGTYTFRVTATLPWNDTHSSTASELFSITVRSSPLIVRLAASRTARVATHFTLTCDCIDPDNNSTVSGTVAPHNTRVTWTCVGKCPSEVHNALANANATTTSVDVIVFPTSLPTLTDGTFQVQVTLVRLGDGGATDPTTAVSATSTIRIVHDDVLAVRITSHQLTYLSSERVVLTAAPLDATQYTYTWTCVQPCALNISSPQVSLDGITTLPVLVLLPDVLSPDLTYTFAVSVMAKYIPTSGNSSFVVRTRGPPNGGRLVCSTESPTSFDKLVLTAPGWQPYTLDAAPLQYRFSWVDEDGSEVLLSGFSTQYDFTFDAPQAVVAEAIVVYRVVVRDANGVSSSTTVPVIVSRASDQTSSTATASVLASLNLTALTGDVTSSLKLLASAASGAKDDEATPTSTATRRTDGLVTETNATSTTAAKLLVAALKALLNGPLDDPAMASQIAYSLESITTQLSESFGAAASPLLASTVNDISTVARSAMASIARANTGSLDATAAANLLGIVNTLALMLDRIVSPATAHPAHRHRRALLASSASSAASTVAASRVHSNVRLMETVTQTLMQDAALSESREVTSTSMKIGCKRVGVGAEPSALTGVHDQDTLLRVGGATTSLSELPSGSVNGVPLCTTWWPSDIFDAIPATRYNVTSNVVSVMLWGDTAALRTAPRSSGAGGVNFSFSITVRSCGASTLRACTSTSTATGTAPTAVALLPCTTLRCNASARTSRTSPSHRTSRRTCRRLASRSTWGTSATSRWAASCTCPCSSACVCCWPPWGSLWTSYGSAHSCESSTPPSSEAVRRRAPVASRIWPRAPRSTARRRTVRTCPSPSHRWCRWLSSSVCRRLCATPPPSTHGCPRSSPTPPPSSRSASVCGCCCV